MIGAGWRGRAALVTGTAQGIGACIADVLVVASWATRQTLSIDAGDGYY